MKLQEKWCISVNDDNLLLDIFLDFGEAMLGAGGEISRVEDSIARMGRAYGATSTNVFIIPSSIELTITFADGVTVTRTRRIRTSPSTDFEKLQALNALSRRCAADRVPVAELQDQIQSIGKTQPAVYKNYLGSILAGSAFCLFFGGSAMDAVFAVLFSALICFLQYKLAPLSPNKVFFLFASSFITGAAVCLTAQLVPILSIEMINIGVVMLLIPGIAITNAVRDALIGDTISGITKLADSLLWAASLAAGMMVAIFLFAR
jgi:uncharacterized membrane protein YjjP (DUF1212 family)